MATIGKTFTFTFIIAAIAITTQYVKTHKDVYTSQELQQKYGPTAVVVGASEGLGATYADLLCQNGLEVVTIARREAELEERKKELVNKHGCKVSTVVLDLAGDDVTTTMQEIFDKHSVGLVVYNAAVFGMGSFTSSLDTQLAAVSVNVESLTRTAHAFASAKRTQDRKSSGFVIMSSTLGDTGAAYVATYGATKAYNTMLAQGLAAEWKSKGIDVLGCVAGPIATPNFFRANNDTSGMEFMIQTPQSVADECIHALGQGKYVIATGRLQKVLRFITRKLLPTQLTVDAFTGMMEKNVGQ
jgi:short-subunit dehydrogenase